MSFVNAVAHVANIEDHHPDLELGYNYCRIIFTTHSIGGLSHERFHLCGQDRSPLSEVRATKRRHHQDTSARAH